MPVHLLLEIILLVHLHMLLIHHLLILIIHVLDMVLVLFIVVLAHIFYVPFHILHQWFLLFDVQVFVVVLWVLFLHLDWILGHLRLGGAIVEEVDDFVLG